MFSLSILCLKTFDSDQIKWIAENYPHLIDIISMVGVFKDNYETLSFILRLDIPNNIWLELIEKYSDDLIVKLAIFKHIPRHLVSNILSDRCLDNVIRQYEAVISDDIVSIPTFEWEHITITEIMAHCSADFINALIKLIRNNNSILLRLIIRLSPKEKGIERLFEAFRQANIYEILDCCYSRYMGEGEGLDSLL